jgi:hypothetical protein
MRRRTLICSIAITKSGNSACKKTANMAEFFVIAQRKLNIFIVKKKKEKDS